MGKAGFYSCEAIKDSVLSLFIKNQCSEIKIRYFCQYCTEFLED